MNWIKTSDALPPIDPEAEREPYIAGASARCLVIIDRHVQGGTYMQFGRYYHAMNRWRIEGTNSEFPIQYWCGIRQPTEPDAVRELIVYVKEACFDGVDYECSFAYKSEELKELIKKAETNFTQQDVGTNNKSDDHWKF